MSTFEDLRLDAPITQKDELINTTIVAFEQFYCVSRGWFNCHLLTLGKADEKKE
jgi:hypothetical protein